VWTLLLACVLLMLCRLLVHSAKDGWEPLCKFLGVPVPDVPYPHVSA
jgi:hypothetical protein